jgi:hypothetical protein
VRRSKFSIHQNYWSQIGFVFLALVFIGRQNCLAEDPANLSPNLPNPSVDSSIWDAELSMTAGFPPVVAISAWGGRSFLIKLIRFDRSKELSRKLDRYSYSFLRPNLRLVSSILVNGIQPRLDIYPLSFLGFTVGHTFTSRNFMGGKNFKRWTGYDCAEVDCNGWLGSSFVESKLKFGYANFFGALLLQRSWITAHESRTEINHPLSYEPESGLLVNSVYDSAFQGWLSVGYKFGEDSSLALKIRRIHWESSQTHQLSTLVIYQKALYENWNFGIEAGIQQRTEDFSQKMIGLKAVYTFADGPEPERY